VNLVELTVVLAMGLAMVTAALNQGNSQYAVMKTYKQVEYYSNDVPRMITAVQNITRGAKSFHIVDNLGTGMSNAGPIAGTHAFSTGGGSSIRGRDYGRGLVIFGEGREETGTSSGTVTPTYRTRIFLVERNDITPMGDRYVDSAGAMDLLGNRYHLAIKSVKEVPGAAGGTIAAVTSPGWYLLRNIADVSFDHIPGTDGLVLMRVYRQFRSGATPQVAFEVVLERR
jgi:hypothetical protein